MKKLVVRLTTVRVCLVLELVFGVNTDTVECQGNVSSQRVSLFQKMQERFSAHKVR